MSERAVTASQLKAFLRSHGWAELETRSTGEIWAPDHVDREAMSVFVPNEGTEHYDRRLEEALTLVAETEHQSVDFITHRYDEAARDLVRLRVIAAEAEKGELPFNYARKMLDALYQLMWSGARAAHEPLADFPRHSRVKAVDRFLDGLTLGQTAEGSYVVQVHSPIAGEWQISTLTDREIPADQVPFERQATMFLADGVLAARTLADEPTTTLEDGDQLSDAVERGASASLCEALHDLSTDEVPASIELQVAWASLRRMPEAVTSVQLEPTQLRRLGHVAEVLSARKPEEDFIVTGEITALKHVRTLDGGGRVEMTSADLPGRARTVHIDLEDDDEYRIASQAHVDRQLIRYTGTLYWGGSKWVLLEPRRLTDRDDLGANDPPTLN